MIPLLGSFSDKKKEIPHPVTPKEIGIHDLKKLIHLNNVVVLVIHVPVTLVSFPLCWTDNTNQSDSGCRMGKLQQCS